MVLGVQSTLKLVKRPSVNGMRSLILMKTEKLLDLMTGLTLMGYKSRLASSNYNLKLTHEIFSKPYTFSFHIS